jgi:TPP-dependent pyruvate/acetoin dehydrogenase alpha subunit
MNSLDLLRRMMLIRAFERALMQVPEHGFQLLSSGEEAVAVGVCAALAPDDQLLSSGRSIAPALARGLDPGVVMAELLGKVAGPCGGRGGRGHISQPAAGYFGAHAVVGGNLTVAAGVALAAQLQRRSSIVACIFGDGACGAGALHEALNIAALWKLPLVFICDNNQYSVSTPQSEALAPRQLSDLAKPFDIPATTVDGMDVIAVRDAARSYVERARSGQGPSFLEAISYRFATHSTATRETRPAEELRAWSARCPIETFATRLQGEGALSAELRRELAREAETVVAGALSTAQGSPYPAPSDLLRDVI